MPQYDYEKILDNIDNQRKGLPPAPVPPITAPVNPALDTLGLNLQRAATANPVEEAKRRKLSGELGVPAAILPPTAQAEEQAFLKNAKAQEIMTKYPSLAKWAQNPNYAAVAGKDMLTLGEIESHARTLPTMAGDALQIGKNLAGSAAAAFPSANAAIWSFVQAAGSILSTNVTKPLADTVGSPDLGEMLRSSAADFRNRQLGMAKDIAPNMSGMGAIERGVYSGVQSAASTLMLLPLSVATGSPAPILAGLSGITAGTALGEATDKGLPLNEALIHATKQGLIEYGTELFPVGNLLKNLTGKTGLLKTARDFMIREGIGEQAATVLQDLDKWATLHPEKPFSDYLAERPEAALETLVATAVGGSIQVGGAKAVAKGMGMMQQQSVRELGRAQRAEENHLAVQQLGAMAAGHPLRERDPAAFHEFMETMAEDGNLSDVYVDGKVLGEVFNQSGITEDELMRKMPELVQQLGEAVKTNGEVRISLADYATYVAGTDVEKGIIDHLRASPDGMTYTEAQNFYKTQKDDLTKQAETLMADTATSEEYKADVQKVHDSILEQMNKAGRFTPEVNAAYAVPFREFYAVNAAKMGMTPSELYKQLPLNFAPMNTGNILNQGDSQIDTPEFKNWFGDSKVKDADGKPLTVYHGTQQDFSVFQNRYAGKTWEMFSNDPEYSNRFATDRGGNVMPVHLAINNPIDLTSLPATRGDVRNKLIRLLEKAGVEVDQKTLPYESDLFQIVNLAGHQTDFKERLVKAGFDGIIMPDSHEGSRPTDKHILATTYIAFNPEQIKSAIGNKGTFNPNDPNILNQSVFHGTPHVWAPEPGFPHGRPRLDKMGTGEGAQAFGWGWYSAENKGIAKGYEETLTENQPVKIGGEIINLSNPVHAAAWQVEFDGNRETAIENLRKEATASRFPSVRETSKKAVAILEAGTELPPVERPQGSLYALDIPDSVLPRLLDWDKPLSEQTPEVRKILLKAMPELRDHAVKQDREDADLLAELLGEPAEVNPNVQLPTTSAQDFYHSLTRKHGSDKAASEYLASIGIVGNRYLDGGSRADGKGTYNYVLWDQATIDKVALLERNGEKLDAMRELAQGNRAGYNPDTFTISLLKGADLSSTLHEGGHFYLEALAELASRPEAPQQIKDDFRKTLDWFEVTEESWRGFNLDQKRPYHEQWAQSFERYMLEGKAPTTEMQPVFARFRAWMLSVYKSLEAFLKQNPLAGKLNDEVRGIFDRLIAAEDSIRATESVRAYAPLFETAEDAGMTPKQFQEYLDLGEQATERAVDDLSSRSLRDMKWLSNAKERVIKAMQNEAKAKRKAVEAEVTREVMSEPINQARTFLKTGETTDPETGDLIKAVAGFKLDSKAVAELFPVTGPITLDKAKLRGMTAEDGLSPDLAAQMFGFPSGEALILELANGESAKEKIQAVTDQRMLEQHGEMSSEEDIERAAEAAIHNEARARFMATGLKILMKSPLTASQLNKAAKAAAENTIASRKVRDLRPGQYERAETKANKEALKLAAKDPQGAISAQRAALLNNRLAKAAGEATTEVEKILRYVAKFQEAGTRKGLDPEYMEQIDDLLRPFDFRKGTTLKQIDKRQSLADWVSEQEALGFEPAIDPALLDEAKLKSYKNMSMEELRGFVDSIKQVEHLGRLKKKLLLAKDEREFDAIVLEGMQAIEDNANRTVEERATPTDAIGIAGKWWRQMTADHRKFASIMREMDGGKDNGFMFNYFLKTMNQAGDNETQMKAEATEALAKLFKAIDRNPVPGNIYSKKRHVPGANLSMTHEQRLMFAMNWGNEGNRQRLLDGGISGNRALSITQAEAILDTLTKEEWDFVQGVWDYIAEYKPQVAALERRLTGVEPEWVEPAPIQTKYGTYKGGYFPVKYDVELSSRSESFEAATDLRMGMKGAFNASATRNGFTKARAEAVINRPILLSYNAISQHVSEVTHRLSWQEWLVDSNRLLKALDNPIREHYGAEILRTLRDTVVDIAAGDAPAKNGTETAINRLRVGSTVVGMGWRVTTALLQPSGLAQSWVRVGGKYIARGVYQFTKSPLTSGEFVNSKSKMMTDRGRTMQREINEVLNTIRAGDKVSAFKASYFTMIGKMQRMVDIPTWLGAYEKAADQLNLQDAATADERARIEEQAAALADQAVLDSQSGGQLKDLAKVQRGSPLQKIFTNFYSYFSATYNLNVEAVRRTNFKSPSQVAMLATDMVLLNSVPVLFSVALKELLKGGCGDDLECLGQKLASEQLNFLFGQMVLLREAGVAIDVASGGQGYGYQGPAGLRFFADLYKTGQQANQGEADMAFFKAAANVAGTVAHFPSGQVMTTLEGIMAIEEGKVQGMGILPAIIAGPPKK